MVKNKLLINIVLGGIIALFVVGCGDNELEHENLSLKSKINKLLRDNSNLKNQIFILKDKNKLLNISLAKSEVDFATKHKKELAKEQKELDKQRELLEKKFEEKERNLILKREQIKNELEDIISMKYITILSILSMFLIGMIILFLLKVKKHNSILQEESIKISNLESERERLKTEINNLKVMIDKLEYKYKSGSKNQVVSKIEEYQIKRKNQIKDL